MFHARLVIVTQDGRYIIFFVVFIKKEKRLNMYKLGVAILTIIWVLDILNIPCMEFLDTTIPINTLGWLLIWGLIPSTESKKDE